MDPVLTWAAISIRKPKNKWPIWSQLRVRIDAVHVVADLGATFVLCQTTPPMRRLCSSANASNSLSFGSRAPSKSLHDRSRQSALDEAASQVEWRIDVEQKFPVQTRHSYFMNRCLYILLKSYTHTCIDASSPSSRAAADKYQKRPPDRRRPLRNREGGLCVPEHVSASANTVP